MFFGNSVNVARFDKQKFEIFEKLTEKQLSFFWRPEEIDVTKDDYKILNQQSCIYRCYKSLSYLHQLMLYNFP
jgi:ribonucleotide reductase beta subunit family protein with ferritin-like domain